MALIASVQIPNLSIAIAQRDEPALLQTPLVLYAQGHQRAIVVAASADAGVRPGTPLRQAIVRCSNAVYRPAASIDAHRVMAALTTLLQSYSPRVATAALSPDLQIELDLGAIDIPQTMTVMQRLAQHIRAATCLVPALSVATTRFVAQHAARHAGSGTTLIVPPGREASFLAPHPITTRDVHQDIVGRLQQFGLHTFGDLARLPLDALQAQFGGVGLTLYRLARGVSDDTIVVTPTPPTLVRRGRFAGSLTNRALLETAIERLAKRLVAQLAAGGWTAGAIGVMLTLEDEEPWNAQRTLSMPTADYAILTEAFLSLSRTANLASGVDAVTLHLHRLVPTVATQLDLFAPTSGQSQQLEGIMRRLSTRYASSFVRARLTDTGAQLPELRVRFDAQELQ